MTLPFESHQMRFLLFRLCLSSALACPALAQVSPLAPTSLVARLDSTFRARITDTAPGCAISVSLRGAPVIRRAYGVADLDAPYPIDSATVFEAGSVSKQFTAAAIMLLVYDGTLRLTDTVRKWIPELDPRLPAFTIRQLLEHQAGTREWSDLVEVAGWPRGTRLYAMPDMVALVARQSALNFPPGREYSYSNSNFILAAEIVSRAAKEPFAAFAARRIFAPLGMTQTRWREDFTTVVPHRAVAWTPDDNRVWHRDMPFENVIGPGGLLTTVVDLERWQENFRSGVVGGARFAADMQQPGVLADGRTTAYARGLEITRERGADVVSHGGSTAGYRAYLGRVPATGASVALLCNNGGLRSDLLGPELLAIANGDTSSTPDDVEPDLGPAATEGVRARLTGQFRNMRTRQTVQLRTFRDGISLNSWVGFRVQDAATFVSMDGARTLTVTYGRNGAVNHFRIATPGGDAIDYERAEKWTPTVSQRAEFTGEYRSADADANWSIRVVGDGLVVHARDGQTDAMVARYQDAFQVPSQGWLVTFNRDARGNITGLDVRTTRMRSLSFARKPRDR
jgi:CubicO group peptidase (beta-lactamase class C family)